MMEKLPKCARIVSLIPKEAHCAAMSASKVEVRQTPVKRRVPPFNNDFDDTNTYYARMRIRARGMKFELLPDSQLAQAVTSMVM
jgi:hypothetical protein